MPVLTLHRTAPTSAELDVLQLYETVALVANDLTAAADSIYAAHLMHARPTENVLATARSAAERAIAAIDACGGGCDGTRNQKSTAELGSPDGHARLWPRGLQADV